VSSITVHDCRIPGRPSSYQVPGERAGYPLSLANRIAEVRATPLCTTPLAWQIVGGHQGVGDPASQAEVTYHLRGNFGLPSDAKRPRRRVYRLGGKEGGRGAESREGVYQSMMTSESQFALRMTRVHRSVASQSLMPRNVRTQAWGRSLPRGCGVAASRSSPKVFRVGNDQLLASRRSSENECEGATGVLKGRSLPTGGQRWRPARDRQQTSNR
jgi:hypothetical protein